MTNETEIIKEEVVSPQETEITKEEVVSPQNAERTPPGDMKPEDFNAYIENIKQGRVSPEKSPEKPLEKTAEAPKKEAYKSFETKEDLQQFLNETVGKRLNSAKQKEEKYNEIENMARRLYPDREPDDAIARIVADIERQAAEESGKSVEDYREEAQLKADALAYRAMRREEEVREEEVKKIQNSWLEDERQLKTFIPDFDLSKAMENEAFKTAVLEEGLSVSAAYIKTLRSAPAPKKRENIFEIGARGERGAEVGPVDPMNMSTKDFNDYIRRIKEG